MFSHGLGLLLVFVLLPWWLSGLRDGISRIPQNLEAILGGLTARWGGILLAMLVLAATPNLPSDDLLRHAGAWKFNYDYSKIFLEGSWPSTYSAWVGFEYIAGAVNRHLGDMSVLVLMETAILVTGVCAAVGIRTTLNGHPQQNAIAFILFTTLFFGLLLPRAMLGRPEVYLTALALIAPALHTRVWASILVLLSPFYWLGLLYAPFALLARGAIRGRIAAVAIGVVGQVLFWEMYTGWTWHSLVYAATAGFPRLINMSELGPISTIITDMSVWPLFALIAVAAWYGIRPVGHNILAYAHFFATDMVRYAAVGFAGMALAFGNVLQRTKLVFATPVLLFFVLLSVFVMGKSISGVATRFTMPAEMAAHRFPEGSRVYSAAHTVFLLNNPASFFARPPDTSLMPLPQQRVLQNLVQDGVVDCAYLQKRRYTHLVEKSTTTPPHCATLEKTYGEWKIWRVTPAPAAATSPQVHADP